MKIFDAHAHIYPAPIAEKATRSIGDFYGLPTACVGSAQALLASGGAAGVERYLVHSVAVTPSRVGKINDFLAKTAGEQPRFTAFCTLHPDMGEKAVAGEIARCLGLGLAGIKLHPDIQGFAIDGENALAIYRANAGRLPILMHTGDDRYDGSSPTRMARAAALFPGTRFIAAHFGGYSRWEELDCYLGVSNVWFDTSSSLFRLPPGEAARLIRRHGAGKFFFGTDFPITDHSGELERFSRLPLTSGEREAVLSANLAEFMGW